MATRKREDTTVAPITGSFEDAVRALLKTPPPPKNLGRPKGEEEGQKGPVSVIISMPKILLALASCALFSICVTGVSAQKGADFSGSWVLDDAPINVHAEIPRRLVVQQSFDRAGVLGGPGLLKVKEIGLDWDREKSYEIADSSKPPTRSLKEVRWHGDYLRIEERERLPSGAAVPHRVQTWRFDGGGRLVIGFVFYNHREGGPEVTQTFAYRRNNQ